MYAWGGLVRLVCYTWASVMILGLMAVIPGSRRRWTFLGQRTLQIYILHRLLRDMMQYWGFYGVITSVYRRNVVFVTALAALSALILGSSCITKIFVQIQKVPDMLYQRWKA